MRRGGCVSLRTSRIVGWTLALVVILVCASLGRWQLTRMHDKRAMLDAVAAVLEARSAVPLARAADADRARAYDWAAGHGRFVEGRPWVLDNQIREGQAGLRVFRLFVPDAGLPLLVDLGWTPIVERAGRLPSPAIVAGDGLAGASMTVRGLLMPPPSSGLALGPAVSAGDVFLMTRVDMQAIGDAAGAGPLAPRVLRLDPELPLGQTRDLDILPNTLPPEKHLGYAVQWFGLALAALVVALVLSFRSARR